MAATHHAAWARMSVMRSTAGTASVTRKEQGYAILPGLAALASAVMRFCLTEDATV